MNSFQQQLLEQLELLGLDLEALGINLSISTGAKEEEVIGCEGTACRILSSLTPGTTITVYANSGNIFGPATFVNFDPATCTVTLTETGMVTPPSTTITILSCEDIEAVSFTS